MHSPFAINAATLNQVPFPEELGHYRAAGFRQVEVWLDKITAWTEREKRSFADAKRELARQELTVIGACFLAIEINGKPGSWAGQQQNLTQQLARAAEVGSPAVALVIFGARTTAEADWPALTDRCGWLADQAAQRGLQINLEFLARLGVINCLSSAIRLIKEVDRSNFGLLLDLYHFYLSESRLEDLDQLPRGKLFMGHLDDARPQPIEWLTHSDRTFPGEGVLPCRRLMREIEARSGFRGPWSIELHSDWVWKLPPATVMQRLPRTPADLGPDT